jgi:hypothetical protein
MLAIVALALSGCSLFSPQESYETAIPTALKDNVPGVIDATAYTSTSGFALYLGVDVNFETDAVSADDLRTMLKLIVENNDLSRVSHLQVYAEVGPNNPDPNFTGRVYVNLRSLGDELGIEPSFGSDESDENFEANWDEVANFVEE